MLLYAWTASSRGDCMDTLAPVASDDSPLTRRACASVASMYRGVTRPLDRRRFSSAAVFGDNRNGSSSPSCALRCSTASCEVDSRSGAIATCGLVDSPTTVVDAVAALSLWSHVAEASAGPMESPLGIVAEQFARLDSGEGTAPSTTSTWCGRNMGGACAAADSDAQGRLCVLMRGPSSREWSMVVPETTP